MFYYYYARMLTMLKSYGLLITFFLIMLDIPQVITVAGQVERIILRPVYKRHFFGRAILHGEKLEGHM